MIRFVLLKAYDIAIMHFEISGIFTRVDVPALALIISYFHRLVRFFPLKFECVHMSHLSLSELLICSNGCIIFGRLVVLEIAPLFAVVAGGGAPADSSFRDEQSADRVLLVPQLNCLFDIYLSILLLRLLVDEPGTFLQLTRVYVRLERHALRRV